MVTPTKGVRKGLLKRAMPTAPPRSSPQATKTSWQDGSGEGLDELFNQIMEDLSSEPSLIVPVYTWVQRRKREMVDHGDDLLAVARKVEAKSISKLDDDWKIQWIVQRADVSKQEILEVFRASPASLDDIMHFALQMPLRKPLAGKLLYTDILEEFLDARYKECGERLQALKANGAIRANHTLDKVRLSPYTLTFTEGRLSKLTFLNGDEAEVLAKHNLGNEHMLQEGTDDLFAKFVLPPLPPAPLASFFAVKQSGPFRVMHYTGKHQKEFHQAVENTFKIWETKARAAIKGRTSDHELYKQVTDFHKDRNQQSMQKARDMAKEKLAKRRQDSLVSLSTD